MTDVFSIFKKKANKRTQLRKTSNTKKIKKNNIFMNEKSRRKAYASNNTSLNYYDNKNINNNTASEYNYINNDKTNNKESNIVLVDFPKLPIKNIESCEDVYNIFYIRDQYLIGNKNITINNEHLILLETILDKLDTAISEMNTDEIYSKKKVLSSVYEKIYNLYTSFKNIKNVFPQLSNAYDCFKKLNKISINYLFEESINHIIWQKALDELIVVKALADIPYFDLSEVEGFDFKKMKSGQRQWYPLYIAKELSKEGLATVEFPFWFYLDNLKNIYKKEFEDLHELTDLPSPFFFEISSMFLENNSFKNSTPIESIGQRAPYKYILKVAGLIQDIRQKRIHKIMTKFKNCNIFSEILIINNIQIYETYCVNYLASVFFQKQNNSNALDDNFDVRNYLFDPFIFSSYNT
ncbi:conserved Plasmodium protein, unknown function [Plasmodium berghei]|uniref:Uncharacterized protein n=1 Tax=Plasmodium berghei TaxID=5821 RepID=A0A1D3PZ82_PLABE|nr:conserved Plasmodium protein, unknown function [Plasmodium berghei]